MVPTISCSLLSHMIPAAAVSETQMHLYSILMVKVNKSHHMVPLAHSCRLMDGMWGIGSWHSANKLFGQLEKGGSCGSGRC